MEKMLMGGDAAQNVEKKQEIPDWKKFEILLDLFGTEKARHGFLETCKLYLGERALHHARANGDQENYKQGKTKYSSSQRAAYHNRIMDTIGRLATESKGLNEEQQAVLRDFASRETVAQAIKDHFAHEDEYYEDEDEPQVNRRDMSEVAYFHSLGREH